MIFWSVWSVKILALEEFGDVWSVVVGERRLEMW